MDHGVGTGGGQVAAAGIGIGQIHFCMRRSKDRVAADLLQIPGHPASQESATARHHDTAGLKAGLWRLLWALLRFAGRKIFRPYRCSLFARFILVAMMGCGGVFVSCLA